MSKGLFTIPAAAFVALSTASEVSAQSHFLRGDMDHNRNIELTDGVFTLNWLFLGGDEPPCRDAADFDDGGSIDIGDAIQLFNFLFLGGRRPSAPYPFFDLDPTDNDNVGCKPQIVDHTGTLNGGGGGGGAGAREVWSNDVTHRLLSAVIVPAGFELEIEQGTTILGDSATQGLLIVERGARLIARGHPRQPIVFTSDRAAGARGRGDWGGVIILGRGDNNYDVKEALAEGLENRFWGGGVGNVIPGDDSGILQYVRVEFGGTEISIDNEVNALSLFGVGSGTQIDHVMTKYNLDDGFEWFGGEVNLKHGLCVGIGDDSFDYSFGANFMGQFWVAQQRGDDADRGFEVDNHEIAFGSTPLTRPVLSNVTLIGDPDTNEGTDSTTGITLRRGAGTFLVNGIITGFKASGLDLDDAVTTNNNPTAVLADDGFVDGAGTREAPRKSVTGTLLVDHTVFHNNGAGGTTHCEVDNEAGFAFTTCEFVFTMNTHNTQAAESPVVDPYNLAAPNFRPQNGALADPFDATSLDSFFEPAAYRGGVAPTGVDWTQEPWVSYAGS